jgi:hypothetical protein
MPPVKELHYFDHLFVPENRKWTGWHIKQHVGKSIKWHCENGKDSGPYFEYLQGLLAEDMFTEQWYRRAYSLPAARNKMTGDITPEYCMLSYKGVEYARSLLGDIKIIIMVRAPVDRALSQIRMNAKNQKIDLASASLEQWMKLASDPVIESRARYSEFVPTWESIFGKDNVLISRYIDVTSNPLELLQRMETFLDLPPKQYEEAMSRVHAGAHRQVLIPSEVVEHLNRCLAKEDEFYRSRWE